MISSEVQRTLVKSPPELWTELSDPESLARHLGELGEITITRVEPENLVEWEAQGTTGTVQISPTGWGTKVTLTVLRELDGAPEGDSDASGADASTPEADEFQAPEPAVSIEPEPTPEPAREPKPAPATEAARRAAGWPSPAQQPGPGIESDLRAAEAVAGPPAEPEGLEAWIQQTSEDVAPEPALESPPQETSEEAAPAPALEPPAEQASELDAPQPRRGLLARLFGRRRKAEDGERMAPPAPPDPPEAESEDADLAVEQERPSPALDATDADLAVEEEPPTPALDGAEEIEADEHAGGRWAGTDEEELAPVADLGPATLTAEEATATPEPIETMQTALEADQPEAEEQDVSDPEAPAAEAETEPDADAADAQAPTSGAGADLAGELRAAEEVAAEEVEAVLTAVLDRLGAAHHRPFSRS
jgi:hypothetical protein